MFCIGLLGVLPTSCVYNLLNKSVKLASVNVGPEFVAKVQQTICIARDFQTLPNVRKVILEIGRVATPTHLLTHLEGRDCITFRVFCVCISTYFS